ncbi:hypothetical protein BsWGS_16749 [Bradybaena similaris]
MERNADDTIGAGDTVDNTNGTSEKNSKIKIQNDENSSTVQDNMSQDGVGLEKRVVTKIVGSDAITHELAQERNVDNQNANSQFNTKGKQCLHQGNKKQLNPTKQDCDVSANQVSSEPPLAVRTGDCSTNFSTTCVKPKIFSGPGDNSSGDTNPWTKECIFDDLKFWISPMDTGKEQLECRQLMEKLRQLGTTSETSYIDGDSYVGDLQAACRKVTHEAFTKSRIATLRKTPASILLPKPFPETETPMESFSSRGSDLDQTVGVVRVDEVYTSSPRFDPYHSECGPDCRRCLFLAQAQNPPHLTPKMVKMARSMEVAASAKAQRNKSDFVGLAPKPKATERPPKHAASQSNQYS